MDLANSRSGLLYFADGGIVVNNLWDPFSPDQLIRYVDDFADCGIDILSQMVFIEVPPNRGSSHPITPMSPGGRMNTSAE